MPVLPAGLFLCLVTSQYYTAAIPSIYALARDCVSGVSNGTAAVSFVCLC